MIFLKLFLTFLKIGAVSFGGGYGMISLIREDCLSNGWLTETELINLIAIAESTPGPIAVNMATFVGASQGGFLGAFLATLGVVLPSFLIIILVATIFTRLLKYAGVKATLGSIKPCIIGMILATAITMLLSIIFNLKKFGSDVKFNWQGLCILFIISLLHILLKKWRKKSPSPILMILFSGVLGIIFFGI